MSVLDYLTSNALNILGITLAVLDFTGASKKVEKALAVYRERQKSNAELLKTEKQNFKANGLFKRGTVYRVIVIVSGTVLVCASIGVFVFDDSSRNGWLPTTEYGTRMTLALILFVPLCIASFWASFTKLIWLYSALHGVFWLLSRPRTGVLGSIGLGVALLTTGQGLFS